MDEESEHPLQFDPELRAHLFQGLSGHRGDVSGTGEGDVRQMLLAIGGPSDRTRSGIDLTAAAKKLGVNRRTVERWVTDTKEPGRPSAASLGKLTKASRQAATTKAGRRASVADARARHSGGATLTITGHQGPKRAGREYRRNRSITLRLAPGDVDAMYDAYEAGGDKGYVGWLEEFADREYMDDWGWDSLDDLDLR